MVNKTLNELFPFKRNFMQCNNLQFHYVNEGQGEPIVMLHGNPSWSFYYRHLIATLKDNYQCIVPDHIGCGFSNKPDDIHYDYTLKSRIDDLESLLAHLNINDNITLVVHDWGGMIGLGYAARYPDRIKRLIILNTSAFHLPEEKPFPWALKICQNTIIGSTLVRGLNAFSFIASFIGVKQKAMTKNIRKAYLKPYNNWNNRIAIHRFIQDIPLHEGDRNYQLVSDISKNLNHLQHVPTLICWGLLDFVFDEHFLAIWKCKMPHAQIHEFDDCGHYILEDAREKVIPLIKNFLIENPI
ncbi:MAG: alpha/beta fold hydrolase [Psychromonas sp.]|nr:alpha/beta fold hydrolase [Psychromonas sp.]